MGMVVYLASPIDLLPEFIFGPIGLIDDLAIVGYGAMSVAGLFYNILKERNEEAHRAR